MMGMLYVYKNVSHSQHALQKFMPKLLEKDASGRKRVVKAETSLTVVMIFDTMPTLNHFKW